VLFESPYKVEIYGDKGYALCDGTLGRNGEGTIDLNGTPFEFRKVNPYAGEIEDFVASIHQGRKPEVDGIEGRRNVELLVAAASQ
jgi:1,5-anhydro-D-fructose reductase (1,5-anhydro-D-mannitol-forming)